MLKATEYGEWRESGKNDGNFEELGLPVLEVQTGETKIKFECFVKKDKGRQEIIEKVARCSGQSRKLVRNR